MRRLLGPRPSGLAVDVVQREAEVTICCSSWIRAESKAPVSEKYRFSVPTTRPPRSTGNAAEARTPKRAARSRNGCVRSSERKSLQM